MQESVKNESSCLETKFNDEKCAPSCHISCNLKKLKFMQRAKEEKFSHLDVCRDTAVKVSGYAKTHQWCVKEDEFKVQQVTKYLATKNSTNFWESQRLCAQARRSYGGLNAYIETTSKIISNRIQQQMHQMKATQ